MLLDYYHQRVNVRVATQVVEILKMGSWKSGNFKKIPEMLGFHGEYPADHPKRQILTFLQEILQKIHCKINHGKTFLT